MAIGGKAAFGKKDASFRSAIVSICRIRGFYDGESFASCDLLFLDGDLLNLNFYSYFLLYVFVCFFYLV
jgi:hypothetical protein